MHIIHIAIPAVTVWFTYIWRTWSTVAPLAERNHAICREARKRNRAAQFETLYYVSQLSQLSDEALIDTMNHAMKVNGPNQPLKEDDAIVTMVLIGQIVDRNLLTRCDHSLLLQHCGELLDADILFA